MLTLRIFKLYRLIKPKISAYQSTDDIIQHITTKAIAQIDTFNGQNLKKDRKVQKYAKIAEMLNLEDITAEEVSNRMYKTTVYTSATQHGTCDHMLSSNQPNYNIPEETIQYDLPQLSTIPTHHSQHRMQPIQHEYQINALKAYIFNLPKDVKQEEIIKQLGLQNIISVSFGYCLLGLPAYAEVLFNSEDIINNRIINNEHQLSLRNNQHICNISYCSQGQKLLLQNRQLIIQFDNQNNINQMLLHLSKFGRILYFNMPSKVTRNASEKIIKQHYKDSDQMVCIRKHCKNGQVDIEYYPPQRVNTEAPQLQDFPTFYQEKQKERLIYQHKSQYAPYVELYEEQQGQIKLTPNLYCIVTYASMQEARNCYFCLRNTFKIDLLKDKEEFEYDGEFRRTILRYVDNEFHKQNQQQKEESLTAEDISQELLQKSGNSLYDRLVKQQEYSKYINDDDKDKDHIIKFIKVYQGILKEIRQEIGRKKTSQGIKTFSELVEEELYDYKFPKKESKLKLKEPTDQVQQLLKQNQDLHLDQQVSSEDYLSKLKMYERSRIQNKLKSQKTSEPQILNLSQQQPNDQDYNSNQSTKNQFSTFRSTIQYRPKTNTEKAIYHLKYNQFIAKTINQYLGIYTQQSIQKNLKPETITYNNPQNITSYNGHNFMPESAIESALINSSSEQQAQQLYEYYYLSKQILKSYNKVSQFHQHKRQDPLRTLQQAADFGLVKQVYKYQPQTNLQAKVKNLNINEASFGEQFRIQEQQNGEKCIVKLSKIEHIYPIQIIEKLQKYRRDKNEPRNYEDQLIPASIMKKLSTDPIQNNIFNEIYSEAGISKKDVQTLLNTQQYTQQQLQSSLCLQMEIEKSRTNLRQSKPQHFAKDPSNIQVKDKNGFFKVSKYRQI